MKKSTKTSSKLTEAITSNVDLQIETLKLIALLDQVEKQKIIIKSLMRAK
jgi:hypothetical protein